MFYAKDWSSSADTTSGIGSEWTIFAGSKSGLKISSGLVTPFDTGTTLARLNTPVTTGAEAYVEATFGAMTSAEEDYIGLIQDGATSDLSAAAIFARVQGNVLRMWTKTANSSTLSALGSAYTQQLVAGDTLRMTIHANSARLAVNGATKVTAAFSTGAEYIYPVIRTKSTGGLYRSVKTADYGVETAPAKTVSGMRVSRWTGTARQDLKFIGVWNGANVASGSIKYFPRSNNGLDSGKLDTMTLG